MEHRLLATSPAPEAPAPEPLKRARASRAVGVARGRVGVQERRGGAGTPVGCSRHQRRRRSKPGHARVGPGPDDSGLGGRRGGRGPSSRRAGSESVGETPSQSTDGWRSRFPGCGRGHRLPDARRRAGRRGRRREAARGAGGVRGGSILARPARLGQPWPGVGRWPSRGGASRRPVCVYVQARARGTLQEHLEAAVLAPDERL